MVAVDAVSFDLDAGESLGIVGESGSGKTTTARIIAGLESATTGTIDVAGRRVDGIRRTHSDARQIQMVFQDPFGSFDPRQRIAAGIEELLSLHFQLSRTARRSRVTELLEVVGLGERHANEFPRNLSGGQRQRVAIARALALEPRLLILDEAVSALDVSVQAQILNLLIDIRERTEVAYLFVSHDLAVVRQVCDRSIVMHHGRVVEAGPTADILDRPTDAYTRQLVDAIPRPGWRPKRRLVGRLTTPITRIRTGRPRRPPREDHMSTRTPMDRLFRPDRIAVIGASAKRTSAGGNQTIRNLQQSRYAGVIDVVNPSGGTIEGLPVTQSIADLPPPDVAFLALPAPAVPDVLEQLAAIGCGAVVVPSSGLTADQEQRIRQIAAQTSMLVHGPNCMGMINANDGIPLWLDEGNLVDVPAGDIALVAQSGSAAIFVARSAAPNGFSKIISTGNEIALAAADYVSWLADDPDTAVIGLVLESIQDPAAFRSAVSKARAAGKPIVVLKVGRTDSGARATTAHTGAIVAPSTAYEALFDELDVPTVADYDELATSLQLLSQLPGETCADDDSASSPSPVARRPWQPTSPRTWVSTCRR